MDSLMQNINRTSIFSGVTDFLTTYDWDFEITRYPSIMKNSELALGTFRLRTNNIVVPEDPQNNPISVFIRDHRFSQPGNTPNYGTVQFSIQDFSDVNIQRFFTQLIYLMSDPNTKAMYGGNPSAFKMDFNIYRLNAALQPVKRWVIQDALASMNNVDDNMTSEKDPLGPTALSFVVDYYKVEYPVNGGATWSHVPAGA